MKDIYTILGEISITVPEDKKTVYLNKKTTCDKI